MVELSWASIGNAVGLFDKNFRFRITFGPEQKGPLFLFSLQILYFPAYRLEDDMGLYPVWCDKNRNLKFLI